MEFNNFDNQELENEKKESGLNIFNNSEIKKKKLIRIIILISLILLITAIILLICFFTLSKDEKDSNKEEKDKDKDEEDDSKCITGENDFCLTCKHGTNLCETCNPYFRLENGKCVLIYSFEAIYDVSQTNEIYEEIKLFNVESLEDYEINKIKVDDQYIENKTNYYNFTKGEHRVRINMNLKNSISLEKFFKNINELISINFTSDFDTSNIKNMDEMFSSAQNLIFVTFHNLNFENVISMKNMFSSCINLEDIEGLDTLNIPKVESTSGLFSGCIKLNSINLENFNFENIKDMSSMFNQCNSLSYINFGETTANNVVNLSSIFEDCYSLKYLTLDFLNTENVLDMSKMFKNCESLLTIEISNFKTNKVENMFGMFENVGLPILDLSHFETKATKNMGNMFRNSKKLYSLKQNFNTENVENMSYMFSGCISLRFLNITMFNFEKCNNVTGIFEGLTQMSLYFDSIKGKKIIEELPEYEEFIIYNEPSKPVIGEIECIYDVKPNDSLQLLGDEFEKTSEFDIYYYDRYMKYKKIMWFNNTNIGLNRFTFKLYEDINMDYMFKDVHRLISVEMKSENSCKILSMISTFENTNYDEYDYAESPLLTNFNLTGFSGENLKSMQKLFFHNVIETFSFNNFNTVILEDISYMFSYTHIKEFPPNSLNTSNVKNMSNLFANSSLSTFNNEGFDTSNAIDISDMFSGTSLLNIDLSNFKTNKVENMFGLFQGSSLTSLDLSNFVTNTTTNMGNMFRSCKDLKFLKFNFNTENVENMEYMFAYCPNLISVDILNFNIEKCNNFEKMFEEDIGLQLYINSYKCEKLIETIPYYVIIIDIPIP